MFKKVTMALLCTLLGSSLYANGNQGIIGLELGYGFVDGDRLGEEKHKSEALEYGFRLGAQNEEWRTMFVFDYYESDDVDDQTVQKSFLTLDYFITDIDVDTQIRPFIGANVGYARYESTLVDETGFIYGAQVGVIVSAGESMSLDLMYRYSLGQVDALNSVSSVTLGINYLY